MANQPLLSPDASGLDRAGWNRLGTIAESAQSALAHDVPAQTASQAKAPGLLGQALAEAVQAFQRDWHRLFHPLESIREWWAQQTQAQTPYQGQGTPGAQAAPITPSSLDATWTQVRDRLFDAANDLQANPREVGIQMASAIPAEHRAALAERLGWLAEMAQTTAKALEQNPAVEKAPEKGRGSNVAEAAQVGEPPPELKRAPPLPSKIRPLGSYPQRQVPPQPLPPTPTRVERPKARAKAPEPERAKAR